MNQEDNVHFQFNEYSNQVKTVWGEFQTCLTLCDVTLSCDDKPSQAHKVFPGCFILCSSNDFNLNAVHKYMWEMLSFESHSSFQPEDSPYVLRM